MAAPTFNDWNAVSQYYGQNVAQMLQQNNVPLSQVGQTIQQASPGSFVGSPAGAGFQSGGSDPGTGSFQQGQFNQQALNQALGQFFGGGNQQPQAPPFNPQGNPQYMYNQLGAAAMGQPMVVNPNPSQQPINAQGGVYSGPQSVYVGSKTPGMPQGIWNNVPGLVGGTAPSGPTGQGQSLFNVPPPTQGAINPMRPAGGAQRLTGGSPFATPPPAPTTNFAGMPPAGGFQMPPSPMLEPGPMWGMVTDKNNLPNAVHSGNFPGPGNPYAGGGTTPGTSTGSIGAAKAKLNSGGRVPGQGNTDTVSAMLTPGEFVMNKDAVQQIGVQNLQRMNQQPQHFQEGGAVLQQNNPPGLNAPPAGPNSLAMAQALAVWGSGNPTSGSSYPMGAGNVRMQDDTPPGRSSYYGATKVGTGDPSLNYYRTGNANAGYNAAANQNQQPPPSYTDFAPRASLVAPPAGYGAAPRAELVGLPAGQGEAYDPKTYGINTGPSSGQMASGIAGGVGAAGQAIAQALENNAKLSWTPQRSAIPNPPSYNQYYNEDLLNPQSRVT